MVRRAKDDRPQRDYYAVLDVPVTASRDEINRAYRRRARATHPDLNASDSGAERDFDEIAAAREVLTDPAARAAYDRMRAIRAEPDRRTEGHDEADSPRPAHSGPSPTVSPSVPVLGGPSRVPPSGPAVRPGPVVWRPSGVKRA